MSQVALAVEAGSPEEAAEKASNVPARNIWWEDRFLHDLLVSTEALGVNKENEEAD